MTTRQFRLYFRDWASRPSLVSVAPPTPDLYEELCRAEIERRVRAREAKADEPRPASGGVTNPAVELRGEFPDTQVCITCEVDGHPAAYEIHLYRPRFHRMRHGRLRSPDGWGETIGFRLEQPLGWLWPDDNPGRLATITSELLEMAGSFSPMLQRRRIELTGEGSEMMVRASFAHEDELLLVEAARWESGRRRATWEIAEDLRERALEAAGIIPEPEEPTLTRDLGLLHQPSGL